MCVRRNCVNCIICEEFMEVCACAIMYFRHYMHVAKSISLHSGGVC